MIEIFKIFGIIGLVLITSGIIIKKRKAQDILYIVGGISLGTYSVSIGDLIFIILQSVFVLAVIYDSVKINFFKK
jgi:hypothetical protein